MLSVMAMLAMVGDFLSVLRGNANVCFFSGNLHLNIVAAEYTPEIESALEPFVYELVRKY